MISQNMLLSPTKEQSKTVSIVAALSENNVIGDNGEIPWKIPEDLKRFSKLTINNTVVMGRQTFESIGEELPNRHNIIVSSTMKTNKLHVVDSLERAIHAAPTDLVFLIGGERIYKEGMKYCKYMFITLVHALMTGDTFFPSFNPEEWETIQQVPKNGYTFITFKRVNDESSSD